MKNIDLNFSNSKGTFSYNKYLAHAIGLHEAIIYSALFSKSGCGNPKSTEWFEYTVDDLYSETTFSDSQQRKAIKKLVECGLIETKVKGTPPKRYFKICDTSENTYQNERRIHNVSD